MNKLLDQISHFLAQRPGFLPLVGLALVLLNFFLQFVADGWFVEANVLLHVGLIAALLGLLLIRPLQ